VVSFCTIANRYTLPYARVLAGALRMHHPDAPLTVLMLDDIDETPGCPGVEVVRLSDLGGFPADLELGDQAWADVAAVAKPMLMESVLASDGTAVMFLEADVDVITDLEPAITLVSDGGVVLMPRVVEPIPDDGLEPSARDLLESGQVSSALIGASAGPDGRAFLSWWSDNLIETARSLAPPAPQPTNLLPCRSALARWLDVARTVFPAPVKLLDDPGFGVSYWNLHCRLLERRDDMLVAGGSRLRCIQFAGFRPDRPYWLSEFATRPRVLDDPILGELCASYAGRLIDSGWIHPARNSGQPQSLANGVPFDERLRRLYERAVAAGEAEGDVTAQEGTRAFGAWLTAPSDHAGAAGVNRYLYDAYLSRPDLREAFADLDGEDGRKLIEWAWDYGRGEVGLAREFLPPRPVGPVRGTFDREIAVNVVGYLNRSLGLGQAARLYIAALQAAGVPVGTITAPLQLPVGGSQEQALARYGSRAFAELQLPYTPPINIVCVNPDGLDGLLETAGDALRDARWTIGQWGWETDVLPAHWIPAFERVDELWVYSSYVADNLGRASPVPVVTVPLPVIPLDPRGAALDVDFGDGFAFLFVFDFFSTLQRKNPIGVVEAFTKAFAPGEGPTLVLKAMNGSFRPQARDELRWRIGDRHDILLIDEHVDQHTYAALIARCDCYVSLHRAEGFGLTLAEAMALGKPVIATGYSGNLEFMTATNSYLVDYKLTRVGPNAEMYPADGTWAEPDLDHAATLMRQVFERPDDARAIGERGARDVTERLSPSAVGAIARARLERLVSQPAAARKASPPSSFATVDRTLAMDPEDEAHGRRGGFGRIVRRLVLRLIRPFTHHERELDRAIVEQLKRLDADGARERRARQRDRARLHELEARVAELDLRGADARDERPSADAHDEPPDPEGVSPHP
jgi:glycosyltransferase involved in cell wall biosynthesis